MSAISILLVHANADACWCARKTLNTEEEFRTAVEKEFHNSTAVFSGEIIEWSRGKIRVRVNKKWKGEAAAEVTLSYLYFVKEDGKTYVDGCSYESFKVGKSYLVYADSFENVLQVYGCSRTQPLNEAERDMKVLDDLKQSVERQLLSQRGLQLLTAKSNPSLDASGGSVFLNLIRPARLD